MLVTGKRLRSKVTRQLDGITANGVKIDQVTFRRCTLAIVTDDQSFFDDHVNNLLRKDLLKICKIIRSIQRLLSERGHPSNY